MQKLSNLKAAEVSLVPQGANRRRFMVFKSADGVPMSTHEQLQKAIATADPEVMKRVSDFLDKSIKKDDEHAGVARTAAQAISRIASTVKGKLSPQAMHSLLDEVGFQVTTDGVGEGNQGGAGAMSVGAAPSHDGDKEAGFQAIPVEHLEKAKEAAGKAYKEHLEKLGHRMYPDAEMQMKSKSGEPAKSKKEEEEKVDKSATTAQLDAATQAKLETVFKQFEDISKENKELKTELAALTLLNKQRELVTKAASFSHLGLPQETVVATLGDAQKAGPEAFERIVKMYETMSEQNRVAKSFGGDLFSERGSTLGGGNGGSESAWSKIEKAASGFVQKSGTVMSKEDGIAKFLETPEGQQLYREHQAARKDGI